MSLSFSDYQDTNKKRQSILGKPKLNSTSLQNQTLTQNQNQTPMQNQKPPTIEDVETDKQKRMNRVNELLNNTGTGESEYQMGNFQPLDHPLINHRQNDHPSPVKYTPLLAEDTPSFGNYQHIYEKPMTYSKPYYATMGISGGGSEMDKIMEKLNYMTHLLEEQKNERTNNIGEEFVLYTFLGVFMIYIVDSFSRSGKYIR
jgi:hypothetical protein